MTEKDEYIIKITKLERDEILAGLTNNQKDYYKLADQSTAIGKLAVNTDTRHKIEGADKTRRK